MATNNKMSGKVRNSSVSSNTRRKVKPRTRGSRTSRVSSASERDDIDTINLDSDDENLTARSLEKVTPAQAWAAFEECIKTIDNSNQDLLLKKPKPNFVSSGTFQKVMVDMYGNTEYGNTKGYTVLKKKLNNMARSTMVASRMLQAAVVKGQEDREREEEQRLLEEAESKEHAEPESVVQVCAKRGWKVLKREVNETVMEHKVQPTKLNWSMLQHTLKQMTNTEKTRQDLYERYGIVPTTLPDGTVVCENQMLSERARAQLYGRNKYGTHYKRPKSYQPPSVFSRTSSRASGPNAARDHKNISGQTKKGRVKIKRPITAKP